MVVEVYDSNNNDVKHENSTYHHSDFDWKDSFYKFGKRYRKV